MALFPVSPLLLSPLCPRLTARRPQDIGKVEITGLDKAEYVDKVDGAKTKVQAAGGVRVTGETDRVYTPDTSEPVGVAEAGRERFRVVRDNLPDVVVWNPWTDKAAGLADFAPKDGYKTLVCVEAGSVRGWQTLEPGDAYEGAQTITAL